MNIAFHRREGLSYRQIARKLGCTPRTAKKYADHPELINQPRKSTPRASIVDAYREQIAYYLDEDPYYRATAILARLRRQGYTGGYETIKCVVRPLRAQKQAKAYMRFETEPGAQGQVDFAELVVELADGTKRKYYLFVFVLGYSRMLYAELLERCDMCSFLQAHQRALAALGGTPSEVLYDRMRNVFLRQLTGEQAQFTQSLTDLAVHYGFAPRVAPAYAPWVKGKVERPIDFVREGFWRGYAFVDVPATNRDLAQWLAEQAQRVHGTTQERVQARYAREKPHLQPLPPRPCDVSERLYRDVRKDCTVAVQGNRYVVEHTLVGQQVVVRVGQPPPAATALPVLPVLPAATADTADTGTADTATADTPAIDTPAIDTPAMDTPAMDTPAMDTPAMDTPAMDTPAMDTPAMDTPAMAPIATTPTAAPTGASAASAATGQVRVFDGERLVVTYAIPEGKGHLVQDPRFYAALQADREQAARKFGGPPGRRGKGRARQSGHGRPDTISPNKPAHPIDVRPVDVGLDVPAVEVQRRALADYSRLGGEVCYA